MKKFTFQDALEQLANHRKYFEHPCHESTFINLFRHGTLEIEICKPDKIDLQEAHDKDEIYFIGSGSGFLQQESACEPANPGDVFFVPAGARHKFVDFSSDFSTWVIFYGPSGGEK